jgi:uncharacterized protein (DUF1499 family)
VEPLTKRRSRAAVAAALLGALAVADAVLGPLLAHLGVVRPFAGFVLFLFALVEGVLGVALAAVAFRSTAGARGLAGRGLAALGLALSAAVVGLIVYAASPGRGLPRINDITTDPDDPPRFVVAANDSANAGRDLGYPREFAAIQRAAYPDLAPIPLPVPPGEALERARRTAESLGWKVTEVRPPQQEGGEGFVEARQESGVFRFVDDVVVRVRATPTGSVVDVRSKSRDGQGDLGVNASRIRAFRDALPKG